MNVCSFCGKGEDQVRHLIRGGGRGDLPVVFICNECVGLCGLAAADGPDDPLDAARWQRITFEGEPYEWHATPVEGEPQTLIVVRRPASTKTAGTTVPATSSVTTAMVHEALRAVRDRL
ncbi:MAG: ClpX C4-type zinc finger protein [Myxococcales bacterium]|nr:ClpX C4-type zinc finger protein [Myxococcales bacterium]MCB9582623.1 hypothetical protein [Polyangiaceae bacterium]